VGRAELIRDGGAAARSDDLFRSEPFLGAEGATHTLRLSAGDFVAAVPLIVREIEGSDRLDATSPYGYPGGRISGDAPPPAASEIDWTGAGLVSVFARERVLGRAWAAGAAEPSELQLHDASKARAVRPRLAEQIRANERAGWEVRVMPAPDADTAARDAFAAAYEQTMVRTRAADRYFFEREYLEALLSFGSSWLLLAERSGEPGAAAIAARSDGVLHYFLGGTADAALEASPFKNVVSAMLDLADELELPLNLGGGMTPGDGLERFKRGFANATVPFRTHEIVCDREEYERLSAAREAGGFFPAYRALSASRRT